MKKIEFNIVVPNANAMCAFYLQKPFGNLPRYINGTIAKKRMIELFEFCLPKINDTDNPLLRDKVIDALSSLKEKP